MENNYEFRKRFNNTHPKNIRAKNATAAADEIVISPDYTVYYSGEEKGLIYNAALDIKKYLLSAFNIRVALKKESEYKKENKRAFVFSFPSKESKKNLYSVNVYKNGLVKLRGSNPRMAAQAAYLAERMMTGRRAPFLKTGKEEKTPAFSPRMIHSGYGLDMYPNEYLQAIAREGIDAILVFVTGVNRTPFGPQNFNKLCDRAASYGIDVYAYSYLKSRMHPEDKGAEEYYDSLYGTLFRKCNGLRGIVFVGESCEFPSHDTHTTGELRDDRDPWAYDKPFPGWWPCEDYPQWLNLVKKVIRREKKEADIVFWSYNWGWAPKENRLSLIANLPKDISLLVTFEMFQNVERAGHTGRTVDYSLFFEGPGDYFLSEAKEAKKLGLRLYTMANCGGLTWDCGTIPYEPFLQQWIRRYKKVLDCKDKYGLCGMMDSHHFGFTPSLISYTANNLFCGDDISGAAADSCRYFYGEKLAKEAKKALNEASDGVRHLVSTDHDQYGPMRVGPAFPLILFRDKKFVFKSVPSAMNGRNDICHPDYDYGKTGNGAPNDLEGEIRCFGIARDKILSSSAKLYALAEKAESEFESNNLTDAAQILEYIGRSAATAVNVKEFKKRKDILLSLPAKKQKQTAREMKETALREIENSKATIPLVRKNSRLGYEPSMEYMGDEEHIKIKIAQVRRMIKNELDAIINK